MAKNNMKLVLGIIGVVIVLTLLWGVSAYNSLVGLDETTKEKWGNIQADYQRRADLVPNLVAAVKSYTTYEGSVLTEITAARSAWIGAKTQSEQITAANGMDSAFARLLAVVENYPNLKANENYLSLQDELAGTENRIKVSRTDYNAAVKDFNVKTRVFPSSIVAGMFGFTAKVSFESQSGAETAPNVGAMLG